MHCANVSHVVVPSVGLQGWPSGMTVGQVPVSVPSGLAIEQPPTRHERLPPLHGWPAATQVTDVHWYDVKSQWSPDVHSAAS